MSWIIGILTFILVIDCLFLILLILVQLPKKEAGLGTAFGSGATDALFGAGTGNVLTKVTKYCTVIFFVITLSLSVLNAHQARTKDSSLDEALKTLNQEAAEESESATAPATVPATTPAATNALLMATNLISTNLTVPAPEAEPAPEPAPAPPQEPNQ